MGRAVDVAGGMKRDGALRGELLGVPKREDMLDALLRREAGAHEAGRGAGAEDLGVARHVIGVGVGNETALGAAGSEEGERRGWIGETERRRDGETERRRDGETEGRRDGERSGLA